VPTRRLAGGPSFVSARRHCGSALFKPFAVSNGFCPDFLSSDRTLNNNSRVLQKTAVLVEISLNDGSTVFGKLFVSPQGRLSDVLNDDRQFLPFEARDGGMVALAKSAIKQVTLPVAEVSAYRGNNPYLILGVHEGATLEELKKAYHHLCMANHPDRIKGLGLTSEFQELATKSMARINSAYAQALKALSA
jgi:hypothetical protein